VFQVFETGPDGDSTYILKVGVEIDMGTAAKLQRISDGGVIYAIHLYREGVKETQFVPKNLYKQVKEAMGSI
jgi:hypothetical protein